MKEGKFSKIGKTLAGMCVVIFCVGLSSFGKAASYLSKPAYLVGGYGSLKKLDGNMEVISTQKIPNLARWTWIRNADISSDGQRLFLALSGNKILVVVRTADMSIEEDLRITFPATSENWKTHAPFDIISASPRYLYISDECYSARSKGFTTVLVDLNTKIAKPIYKYGFVSKRQIQISPNQEKMALYDGGRLHIIDISSGDVVDSIKGELIAGKWILWSNVDWDDRAMELYVVPQETNLKNIEKLCIDMKSHRIVSSQKLPSKTVFGFGNQISKDMVVTTPSTVYIQERRGSIQIFDRHTGSQLEKLDYTLFEKIMGQPTGFYVSPDEKLLFYRKDKIKHVSNDKGGHDISSICIISLKLKQIVNTIDYSEEIVSVLFSK